MALAAGNMGSWDWIKDADDCIWDDGQYRIFGVERKHFAVTAENVRALIHPDDWGLLQSCLERLLNERKPAQSEFRVKRPNGEIRWCIGTAAPSIDKSGRVTRVSGVTVDITDRKVAEERQALLAREVDHRAKNALALVQSIVRLTRAGDVSTYTKAVEGRIRALSRAHTVLSLSRWQGADIRGLVEEELAPYRTGDTVKIVANGACHQCRQIWRAVFGLRSRGSRLGIEPRVSGSAMDRNRRPCHASSIVAGIWHADHHGQRRGTARRTRRVRLGF
jgi:PAS domain S-box-containing protein